MEPALPLVEAYGTHFDVGVQIGEACRRQLHEMLRYYQGQCRARRGLDWHEVGKISRPYLAMTEQYFPQYVDELHGVARGAGLELMDVFALACREPVEGRPGRGCTDFVAGPGATADGSVLACHNEDWDAQEASWAVVTRIQAGDELEFLATSYGGIMPTTGMSAAGFSLTGNALSPNDERVGVPRMILVRAILGASNLRDAFAAAVMEPRASSYNNILADSSGEAVSIEGSATDWEVIPLDDGLLVHTNHYVTPRMQKYEADRRAIVGSVLRYHRARHLLESARGRIDMGVARAILSDHAGAPASICRHPSSGGGGEPEYLGQTVFSVQVNLTQRIFWVSQGLTCESVPTAYRLRIDETAAEE